MILSPCLKRNIILTSFNKTTKFNHDLQNFMEPYVYKDEHYYETSFSASIMYIYQVLFLY